MIQKQREPVIITLPDVPEKEPISTLSLEQQQNYHIDMAKLLLAHAKEERRIQDIKDIARKAKEENNMKILHILKSIPVLLSGQKIVDSKAKEVIKELEKMKVPDSSLPKSFKQLAEEHIKKAEALAPLIKEERKKVELATRMEMARLELIRHAPTGNLDFRKQPSEEDIEQILQKLDAIKVPIKPPGKVRSSKYYTLLDDDNYNKYIKYKTKYFKLKQLQNIL